MVVETARSDLKEHTTVLPLSVNNRHTSSSAKKAGMSSKAVFKLVVGMGLPT